MTMILIIIDTADKYIPYTHVEVALFSTQLYYKKSVATLYRGVTTSEKFL